MTKPKQKHACPLCHKCLDYVSRHLVRKHGLREKSQEHAILCKLASGRIPLQKQKCRMPGCGLEVEEIGRHLSKAHPEICVHARSRELSSLKLDEAIRQLQQLSAAGVHLFASLDLLDCQEEQEQLATESDEELASTCQNEACTRVRETLAALRKDKVAADATNRGLRRKLQAAYKKISELAGYSWGQEVAEGREEGAEEATGPAPQRKKTAPEKPAPEQERERRAEKATRPEKQRMPLKKRSHLEEAAASDCWSSDWPQTSEAKKRPRSPHFSFPDDPLAPECRKGKRPLKPAQTPQQGTPPRKRPGEEQISTPPVVCGSQTPCTPPVVCGSQAPHKTPKRHEAPFGVPKKFCSRGSEKTATQQRAEDVRVKLGLSPQKVPLSPKATRQPRVQLCLRRLTSLLVSTPPL